MVLKITNWPSCEPNKHKTETEQIETEKRADQWKIEATNLIRNEADEWNYIRRNG